MPQHRHPWPVGSLALTLTTLSLAVAACAAALGPSSAALHAQDVHVRVSPDSKGNTSSKIDFPTIQMAMDHAPEPGPRNRLYLHIAPGTYRERVWVSPLRPRTTFLGTGTDPAQVIIVAGQSAKAAGGTFFTETVQIGGTDFQADNVTFQNDAGPVGQAVAIAVNADRAIFKHCRFIGDQDTLFANVGRQLYIDSYIEGGVDFIFGNAAAVFERSELHIIRPGYLTAQSRTTPTSGTGYVVDRSRVSAADLGEKQFYLGRPWRTYSRTVFMETELPAALAMAGWDTWTSNTPDTTTPFYAEYRNVGPGAATDGRVAWSRQLTAKQAAAFRPDRFLTGPDHWQPMREAARLP